MNDEFIKLYELDQKKKAAQSELFRIQKEYDDLEQELMRKIEWDTIYRVPGLEDRGVMVEVGDTDNKHPVTFRNFCTAD